MKKEVKTHLKEIIIPFWSDLKDDTCGGFFGLVDDDLKVDEKAVKGSILNSRILWFFSNAYTLLKDPDSLSVANHAYDFLREHCYDRGNGGVYWSISANGIPQDTSKYTYAQAFAVYGLASYYEASGNEKALELAYEIFTTIEEKCTDNYGYKEAFDEKFVEVSNEELSENGIIAAKTMNTLLHLLEAYTELLRVDTEKEVANPRREKVKERLEWLLSTFDEKVYNKELRRLEVFFDEEMNSLIDLHSYGHDIEGAWLIDRAVEVLGNRSYFIRMTPLTANLSDNIYKLAFQNGSLAYECEDGKVNEKRVWWTQAEAVVGFIHAARREPQRAEYKKAAEEIWSFIKEHLIDPRPHSEWFSEVDKYGVKTAKLPIADPWKCPYHNGRMCFEVMKYAD